MRYLTKSEQRAMDGALRRSFKVLEDPKLTAALARVERLEAALRFYADEANWRATIEHTPEFMLNGRPRRDAYRKEAPVVMDQGKEARAALGDATSHQQQQPEPPLDLPEG